MSNIKINEDKILKAVLSNEELIQEYKYKPNEYTSVTNAFYERDDMQPIVVAVAIVIRDIKNENSNKEVYNKIIDLFNKNLV